MRMVVLFHTNKYRKKGISEMVSYTLLVAIAVGLSVVVFVYLKLYVPKEKPECMEDISLQIKEVKCEILDISRNAELTLSLYNNGLHKIDAAYIRFDELEKTAKKWINDPSIVGDSNFYFYNALNRKDSLLPGEEVSNWKLPIGQKDEKEYALEAQPAVFSDSLLSACKFIAAQKVNCEKKPSS